MPEPAINVLHDVYEEFMNGLEQQMRQSRLMNFHKLIISSQFMGIHEHKIDEHLLHELSKKKQVKYFVHELFVNKYFKSLQCIVKYMYIILTSSTHG